MNLPVVLDADGLAAVTDRRPSDSLRALLDEAWRRGRDVYVPAVVCAEVCRGVPRTRAVESALARHSAVSGERSPIAVVPTDFALARQVGAILHAAISGSEDIVDAHVVAVCAVHGGGIVVTADPHDIERLALGVPAARIVTRSA